MEAQHDPTRLSNLHAYFNCLLPFGRGIGLQHKSCFGVFMKSKFEELRAYTQEELDQQVVWAGEFDHWWEHEGQYHRAGGGQYERTFAWWAWLNREQQHKAKVDEQQKRIDEIETGSLLQSNHIAELTANLKQAVAELNSRETRINLLIQKWEKDAEYADQIASEDFVQNTLNDCIEELRQAIKGDMNEQHINR